MADLETRLTEGLRGTAERAPHAGDLASGARGRLRRRRRTTAAVVAAALVVVAVPVGLTVAGGDGRDRRETTVADPVPDDWRVESWRDLTLRVPPEWGWGGGTDWCIGGRDVTSTPPQVSRPGGVIPAIACSPSQGYGVHFEEPSSGELPPGTEGAVQQYSGDRYPDGAWLGHASTGQAGVWVVTDDRRLTRQVLDTVEPIREVDANGCAIRAHTLIARAGDQVSVCRYSRDGRLEQSELLSPSESRTALAAVRAAGSAAAADPACRPSSVDRPVITLQSEALYARLLPSKRCGFASVFLDEAGRERLLTEDVLHWALSPGWSGAVSGDVPLPEELRTG